ncbi:MAG: hypothetical protein J5724_01005 [Ruminococcus sp.]|uniref:hypothetical protein n=1 Tax=Ruminococcus sp. TaxID=41978 RepID=UPI001B571A48|nr:hypothetical protein [Ruminococcus sp.]MBO4492944.1 hypothetical protein [Ruminococcus sp.]MBP5433947.1 hypothetical protein [Ruminococcus sp.]
MGFEVLRSVKGGYSKGSVIAKLDALNGLLLAVEEGMPREKALSELERIKQSAIRTEKGGFFGAFGFSVEDTDAYISDLVEMIEKKIQ